MKKRFLVAVSALSLVLGVCSSAQAQVGGSTDVIDLLGIEQIAKMQVSGAKSLSVWLALTNANRPDVRMTESTYHLFIIDRTNEKQVEIGTAKVKDATVYGLDSEVPLPLRCNNQPKGCTLVRLDIEMEQGCPNLAAIFNVLGEPQKAIDIVAEISGYFGVKSARGYVEHPSRAVLTFKSQTEKAILFAR